MAVIYEKDDHIVKITLNRPEVLNAFNQEMHKELNASFVRFREDTDAWVAIVRGAGDRAFSVGQDFKELGEMLSDLSSIPTIWDLLVNQDLQGGLELYKPVIAAIHGYCIGEGLCLIMACDLRLAAQNATFAYSEVALGMPTIVGAVRTAELMGLSHALELLLLGERRDAAWAYRTGLVNEVVSNDQLMGKAMAWAKRLCEVGPIATRCTKEVAIRSRRMGFYDAVRMGEGMRRAAFQTRDAFEGIMAFAEKRQPKFEGR
jgi:E-phenylitaconyl-CoA hydratase